MKVNRIQASLMALVAAALVGVSMPSAVQAQSGLATSDAAAFVGNWDLLLSTGQGDLSMGLMISDMDGTVGATIDMPDLGASQDVEDIMMSGDDLVLEYTMDAQGQMVPVTITLTPAGSDLDAEVDFASGMFVANGTATAAD